uniref:stizolobate synthase n=1 Tax=Kewa caespitosa TaxID=2086541 RepID=A0A5B8XCZ7_9CARY|nr:DODAa1 [Kewa caespitosa]QED21495.1 DODAa1 [Kewa caespitosa]
MGAEDMLRETFFISHGNPIMLVDESMPARHFYEGWKEKVLSKRPKSILVVSSHWCTSVPTVTAGDHPDIMHDFVDCPASMYQLKYPVSGAPDVAKRVQELLTSSGFKCELDMKYGFDHGTWVPLFLMYPEADIPVCQLSIQLEKDATYHYNLGRALAPLKDEGVLIIGSGVAVRPSDDTPHFFGGVAPWATEFDDWVEETLISGRYEDVIHYQTNAPNCNLAQPEPDHFYQLHVALGAAGQNSNAELVHRSWDHGTLSYASYKFTST